MSERSLFGMSGHFACMSYFLRRGYNVAVPVVDLGDDIIVIHDDRHELRRVQVKSGNPLKRQRTGSSDVQEIRFKLKRGQLADDDGTDLYYMLMAWVWGRWSFVLLSRIELVRRKTRSESRRGTRGRLPRMDHQARSDDLTLTVAFSRDGTTGCEDATLWGESLSEFLNSWTDDWPDLTLAGIQPELHPIASP